MVVGGQNSFFYVTVGAVIRRNGVVGMGLGISI
jgi:hypothetical protein